VRGVQMVSMLDVRMAPNVREPIPARERLIVALDVPSNDEALVLVERLGDSAVFYKLGLELFMAGGYVDLLNRLVAGGKKVMVDLKFFDVPETVASAVARLNGSGATFCTVHGNTPMLRAAAAAATDVGVLAVTVLTSMDQTDIDELGFEGVPLTDLVRSRARRAAEAGCAGVVCSALEASGIRRDLDERDERRGFVIVTPGIRPVLNRSVDDQKRVTSPAEAIRGGADHVVVGRPIRDARDPKAAAEAVQREIAEALA
jgi:orotidine-5'-phosphate decarboxylase